MCKRTEQVLANIIRTSTLTPDEIAQVLASPNVVRIARGWLLKLPLRHTRWEREEWVTTARAYYAVICAPPGSALCGPTAAFIMGVPMAMVPQIHVLTPKRSNTRVFRDARGVESWRINRHTYRTLPHISSGGGVVEYLGIRVTEPSQTIIDCLRLYGRDQAFEVAEGMMHLCSSGSSFSEARDRAEVLRKAGDIVDLIEIWLDKTKFVRGSVQAKSLLGRIGPLSDSIGESRLKMAMNDAGLFPEQQVPVLCGDRLYFPDFAWPDLGVAIEFDGIIKYGSDAAVVIAAEKARQFDLYEKYPVILRITWAQLRHPERIVARVRRALMAVGWKAA